MHQNSHMRKAFVNEYKTENFGWPHPVNSPLFSRMKVRFIICILLIPYYIIIAAQKIPYNYFEKWMIVAQYSSGQLFFDITPGAPQSFVWKPYNDTVLPSIFHDRPPHVVQDPLEKTTPRTLARIVSANTLRVDREARQEIEEEASAESNTEFFSIDKPTHAAFEEKSPSNATQPEKVSGDFGHNLFYHASKVAEMMELLSNKSSAPNLTAPDIHQGKKVNISQVSHDSIVYAKDEVSLTKESSRLHHIRLANLRARRQISPEITAELGLSNAQLNSLKA